MKAIENILEVRVGEELYGFDADAIEQILTVPAITPVPLSDASMRGVTVLSGRIAQVLDLGTLLGREGVDTANTKARLLTLSGHDGASFVVDEVVGMLAVEPENLEANDDDDAFLEGFYKTGDKVVQLLKIETLLGHVHLERFVPLALDRLQADDATGETVQKQAEDATRALFFRAGTERFAIDIESLRELIFAPEEIVPIAGSDAMGMITLRDEVIAMLDMDALLGFASKTPDDKSRALIASHEGKSIALLVDEVEEVRTLERRNIEPLPGGVADEIVASVYKEERGVTSILSTDYIRKLVREYHIEDNDRQEGNDEEASEADVSEIAVFQIGDEEYAFDIEEVQEIIRYDEITPVPEAPEFVEGVLNLRGNVISIVSLPERLGFEKNITDKTKIIVCAVGEEKIGFIVDDVNEILFVEDEYIAKSKNDESLFDEIINLDNGKRVILKIKVANILDEETLEKIRTIDE